MKQGVWELVQGKYAQTKPSPMADEMALVNRNTAITHDLMFTGAFVKAYSRPVMEAKISLNAIRT